MSEVCGAGVEARINRGSNHGSASTNDLNGLPAPERPLAPGQSVLPQTYFQPSKGAIGKAQRIRRRLVANTPTFLRQEPNKKILEEEHPICAPIPAVDVRDFALCEDHEEQTSGHKLIGEPTNARKNGKEFDGSTGAVFENQAEQTVGSIKETVVKSGTPKKNSKIRGQISPPISVQKNGKPFEGIGIPVARKDSMALTASHLSPPSTPYKTRKGKERSKSSDTYPSNPADSSVLKKTASSASADAKYPSHASMNNSPASSVVSFTSATSNVSPSSPNGEGLPLNRSATNSQNGSILSRRFGRSKVRNQGEPVSPLSAKESPEGRPLKRTNTSSNLSIVSNRSNKSISSTMSKVGRQAIEITTLPWKEKRKGENIDQLLDSGFFTRTELPPIKITRLPVLTMSPTEVKRLEMPTAGNSKGKTASMTLTPTAFYNQEKCSMRYSWSLRAEGETEDGEKKDIWIPAHRFSWEPVEEKFPQILGESDGSMHAENASTAESSGYAESSDFVTANRLSWSLREVTTDLVYSPTDAESRNILPVETARMEKGHRRRSWVLDLGSPQKPPKEVKILAAIPEEEADAALPREGNQLAVAKHVNWSPRIFSPANLPAEAGVLAVIAEEDSESGFDTTVSAAEEARASNRDSWPMVVKSPGLPTLRMIGLASIGEGEEQDSDESIFDDAFILTQNYSSDMSSSATTRKASASSVRRGSNGEEILPLQIKPKLETIQTKSLTLENGAEITVITPEEDIWTQAPYIHGDIRLNRPTDALQKDPVALLGELGDELLEQGFQRTEEALLDNILSFFSGVVRTSDTGLGASEDEGDEDPWDLSNEVPGLDDEFIEDHAMLKLVRPMTTDDRDLSRPSSLPSLRTLRSVESVPSPTTPSVYSDASPVTPSTTQSSVKSPTTVRSEPGEESLEKS